MKAPKTLRDIFSQREPLYRKLSEELEETLKSQVEKNTWWSYHSRVKDKESFFLKMETGRVPEPAHLEDFFACTIVVPTLADISSAEDFVAKLYPINSRRPEKDSETYKRSSSFVFDDLRLYVQRPPQASGKNSELDGIVFEIQIKTILQHAWSVATHDLIYKSDTISWPLERIAYQVKAMLEHAEVAIASADKLANSQGVAKMDHQTAEVLTLIQVLQATWPKDALPADVKRLAETVLGLLRIAQLEAADFAALVNQEIKRSGVLSADLSPYGFTLQALANDAKLDFEKKFNHPRVKSTIVVHSDMDVPAWMKAGHRRIINL